MKTNKPNDSELSDLLKQYKDIVFAPNGVIDLYTAGISYREIVRRIYKEFDVSVSTSVIRNIIVNLQNSKFKDLVQDREIPESLKGATSWSVDAVNMLVDLYNRHLTNGEIAEELNKHLSVYENKIFTANSVSKKLNRLRKKQLSPLHQTSHTTAINNHTKKPNLNSVTPIDPVGKLNEDGTADIHQMKTDTKEDGKQTLETTLEVLNQEKLKDENYVLRAFGYDPKKWRIIRNRSNFYQQASNEYGIRTLWQVKIDVEPIGKAVDFEDLTNMFNNHPADPEVIQKVIRPGNNSVVEDRNLVLSFADLHFGILKAQTIKPYQTEIIDNIISNPTRHYDNIVFEQLGDLFHSDSFTEIKTQSGTLLSTDGQGVDMETAVNDALDFYCSLITAALKHSDSVTIYHTQGNHSGSLEYMFLVALEQKFPQITIHKNIAYRTAYRLGNVGIMLAHGDTAKNKLPMLFANEYSDIWGKSKYREIHSGHFHFELVKDDNGVVFRQLGTPKPSDGYELKNGYTMARNKLQVLEFDKDSLKTIYNLG